MTVIVGARIETAEDFFPGSSSPAEQYVAVYWGGKERDGLGKFFKQLGMPDPVMADVPPSEAFVSAGRWLVRCRFCPGAQRISETDSRKFCVHCSNVMVKGAWVPVVFPPERAEIEAALAVRKIKTARNWERPETVELLLIENKVHV